MKKSILASTLAVAFCAPAAASSYYVVVPMPAKAAASAIAVALAPQHLPAGMAGSRYPDFDFRNALTVTGDPDFNPEYVRWTVVSGTLPAGLAISSKGTLTGIPGADGAATFELKAYYKSKEGVQRYVLTIKERGSVATVLGTGMLDWGAIDRTQLPQVRSIAVSNTGDRPMSLTGTQFSGPFELVGSTCMSVAPGGTCSLAYRLNDTTPGDYGPATVGLSGAAGGVATVKLSGRVLGPLVSADSGSNLDFGSITQTDAVNNQLVTWRNKGNTPMSLAAGALAAPFSLVSNSCTAVAPGATCQVTFALNTAAVGDYSSSVAFTGGGTVAAANLSGKVVAYSLSSSLNPVAFGNVPVGTTVSKKTVVTNNGASRAPLALGNMGAPFTRGTTCGSVLEPGASCDVTVTYSPTDLTSKSAALLLPGLTIPVTGAGDKVSIETAGAGRRWQDGTYAASCNAYLTASGNYRYAGATGSGIYTVDPDGSGSQPAVDAYCDMTTDGGGWMLATNVGRNGFVEAPFMVGGGNYNVARNPASLVDASGGIGLNRWANNFVFSMSRLEVVAGDDVNQVATFYKTVTYANMVSWATFGAIEPNPTKTCTNLALTQNCTTQPFDHDRQGTQDAAVIMRGVDLRHYGYPAGAGIPLHGGLDRNTGGFCSVTGNENNNQWHDSFSDGHWGNGLRIWVR